MQQVGQGGTITLRVQYQTGAGALVDPVSPTVDIIRPDETAEVVGAIPTRESTGRFYYVHTVDVDDAIGEWAGRFGGIVNGGAVTGDDPFRVVAAGVISPIAEEPLVTLAELKVAIGIDPADLREDDQLQWAIDAASAAIRSYTDRDFGLPAATEARSFDYDGSGWLDVDDATSVTSVSYTIGAEVYTLDSTEWQTGPTGKPIISYLHVPTYLGMGSPEMGFARNMDVLAREGRLRTPSAVLQVDATWGWPVIPTDVKQAAIWTAMSIKDNPGPWLTESIEGYSRTIGRSPSDAIPERAKVLLAPYLHWNA